MPRVRFTVWRLMVAVAVAATLMSPVMLGGRISRLRDKEADYAHLEKICLRDIAKNEQYIKDRTNEMAALRARGESEAIVRMFEPSPLTLEDLARDRRVLASAVR